MSYENICVPTLLQKSDDSLCNSCRYRNMDDTPCGDCMEIGSSLDEDTALEWRCRTNHAFDTYKPERAIWCRR